MMLFTNRIHRYFLLAILASMLPALLPGQTSFGPMRNIVGPGIDFPGAVFAADLDGDGDQDVLSASYYDDRIAWYENRLDEASADFGHRQTVTTAADDAQSVFAADLDGDGDQDVLSASSSDYRIAWYENRLDEASADFGPQQTITTAASGAYSVFAADLDGDGDQDVLSASYYDDRIAWYENRLDEASVDFGPQQTITAAADGAKSVFAVDLDGDGDQDVVSASSADDRIAWYENRLDEASADFGPQQTITTAADGANSVFAADIDGDGDQDVLSASRYDDRIAWYENRLDEESADFGSQQTITTAADGAYSVFAADFDGDGDQDVLSASYDDDRIAWYENTHGAGTFGAQQTITTAADGAKSVFAADLDGDGDVDVLSASFYDHKIAWYENRLDEASADFGPQQTITTAADGAKSVFAVDLDGDGDQDVLSASYDDDRIAWYENRLDEASADF
ncbi:VCBS repeat-containing protein, partial [bacterium]|nr:VCBS repeat-containing protein [bacterium]